MKPDMDDIYDLEHRLTIARERLDRAVAAMAPKHKGGEWQEYRAAEQEVLGLERKLAAAKGDEYAETLEFPVRWDGGAPMPHLMKNDHRALLAFLLREPDPNWDGTYVTVKSPADEGPEPLGLVEFNRCMSAKLGAPNDEVFEGHPLTCMTREMKAQNLRPTTIADYRLMLDTLRRVIPSTTGPTDITPTLAQRFKNKRMDAENSPYTVRGNLIKLSVIWSKWLIGHCRLPLENPWEEIEKPKVDDPEPRYIEPEEAEAFFAWLNKRWDGWRLPVLIFEVIGITGRRIFQTCSLPASCLVDGRINFSSDINKSRKREFARLPEPIFKELEEIKGRTYLWERYSEQLNTIYRKRGKRKYAQCQEFHPKRLKRWLQKEIIKYNTENKDTPGFVPFTAHNFRDTAMTKAWDADIDLDRAAIAFGCNRETMKKHYIRKEALAVADAVFEKIHGKNGNGKPTPTVTGTASDVEKSEQGESSGSGE